MILDILAVIGALIGGISLCILVGFIFAECFDFMMALLCWAFIIWSFCHLFK